MFFAGRLLFTAAVVIPLAAIAAALVLAVEAALGLVLLGWLFERFDVSAETPALKLSLLASKRGPNRRRAFADVPKARRPAAACLLHGPGSPPKFRA